MIDSAPAGVYEQRIARFGAALARSECQARRNGNLNLVLFFGAVAALAVGAVRDEVTWYWLAAALAVAFVAGLVALQRSQQKVAQAAALLAANQEGLARLERNWAALPPPPARLPPLSPAGKPALDPVIDPVLGPALDPATAADLDLLGTASLQHLLNTPATPAGQAVLQAWLLTPASPSTVEVRQAAVRELAPLIELRDTLAAQGRQMGEAQEHYSRFITWAERAPWLASAPLLLWAARLLPLLALALGAALWFGWLPLSSAALSLLLGGVLLTILILALTAGGRAGATIAQVEAQQEVFAAYARLFEVWEQQPLAASELRRLQARLGGQGQTGSPAANSRAASQASRQMRRLQRLMPLASIRRWMLFLPVELFTLWNIHLLWLLERWQAQAGSDVRGWLAALGEFEALAALATLHHDHPDWCFPKLEGGEAGAPPQVEAAGLAHPLLPPAAAVGNDAAIGPPGSFLLVTGSNMSGKSTLLRAIGLNCILAQTGAPVCARSLRLPPVLVASSMRVQDSLSQGVSYFLAELHSLKAIVDRAEHKTSSPRLGRGEDEDLTLLYLLDEILQGTNSAERQIAARQVIGRLVASGAIGAVSTHDLALAAAPELADAAVAVHFTEHFAPAGESPSEGPAMHFDYKLRPGVATSTNALKLMQLIGLSPLEG